MDELQSDDLYIPALLLNLPSNAGIVEQNLENAEAFMKSFMKNVENWSECFLVDEYL
jgi:hypothetical protein